ncbi:SDR family NAD(P)-dependent oxidoreductase [Glutamicibacter arilaitensis]|uniref:SDR family NAD(P)-dependent oxidoreductase n=1 Tax=Glutamicibacter arilaitensis TaxID=256701 RepID=UPI00384DF28E
MSIEARAGALDLLGYGTPHHDVYANRSRWAGLGEGKTAVITGANSGLGFFTSLALAESGAHVVLACRNEVKAEVAMKEIRERVPHAKLEHLHFEASSLESATALGSILRHRKLDILIANAGIIRTPATRVNGSLGYEAAMSTNFLGHARLVGELAEIFSERPLRFISLGSVATRLMKTDPNNLALNHSYHAYRAYAQSKAAVQAFTLAMDHRLKQLSWPSRAIAVHPGYSISGLSIKVPGINEPPYSKRVRDQMQASFAQGKHEGSVSIVEAALNPGISESPRGTYLGPRFLSKGESSLARPAKATRRKRLMDPVWKIFVEANHGIDPFQI